MRSFCLRFLSLIAILLFHDSPLRAADFAFSNLMTESVWNHRVVYSIAKDQKGLIWIGTDNGLYRYNGYQYRYYSQPELNNNTINKLFLSEKGLLIGTNSGLCIYDPDSDSFSEISLTGDTKGPASPISVRTIYYFDGTYYIGTNDGLLLLDSELRFQSHVIFASNDHAESSNIVRALQADSRGRIWVGTYNGCYRFTPSNSKIEFIRTLDRRATDPVNNLVLSFERIPGRPDELLIGHETGLSLINIQSLTYRVFRKGATCNLSNNSMKCVKYLSDSLVLLGTDNGLNLLNLKDLSVVHYFHEAETRHSLSDNIISDIFLDRENRLIWLGTNRGVSRINLSERIGGQLFTYSDNSLYATMRDIGEDTRNRVWIATTNGVLCCRDGRLLKLFDTEAHLRHNNSTVVFEDAQGRIWIGTLNGINCIDPETFRVMELQGVDDKYVRGIHQTSDGNIWVVDDKGVLKVISEHNRYRLKRMRVDNPLFNRSNTEILVSGFDRDLLWLGANNGIYCYHTLDGRPSFVEGSSDFSNITAMKVAGGRIFFGTPYGIFCYEQESGTFSPLPVSNNKISVVDLALDGNSLWIVARQMLYHYDLTSGSCSRYDYIKDVPFDGETPQCIVCTERNVIVGGYGQYVKIDKRKITRERILADMVITRVIAGDSLQQTSDRRIALNYDNRGLKIEFALLNYPDAANNKYKYRLKGFDEAWICNIDGANTVEYQHIPPGEYVFEVCGANEDDVWSDRVARLEIGVSYPWWRQPWAYALYVLLLLLFLGAVAVFIRWRIRVLERRQSERLKQESLRSLNAMRMQFLANVSHEFKTPLSLILGPVEVLSEELQTNERMSVQLRIMHKNVMRLRRLVEHIMNLCKLENNEMKFHPQLGELVPFVRNIVETFAVSAEQRQVRLSFVSEVDSVLMMFDEEKLEEILYNLIDNALKFTPKYGEVSVLVSRDRETQEQVCVEVKDSGIGIASEELDRIFEKFYQSPRTQVADQQGTGIGLNIVKQFVEMHNGRIEVASDPGRGSTFRVFLSIISVYEKYVDAREPEDKEKPLLVVVEDNPDMREYLKVNLQDLYNILLAEDGTTGWELIRSRIPDLILSDIVMPGMDGLELARKVRGEFQTEHIPLILLTALSEEMKLKESLEVGATTYMTKPFSISVLRLRIAGILSDRKKFQEKIRLQVLQQPASVQFESREERFVHDFVKIVEQHMDNPELDVELLCKHLGYSHQQTYRKIHAVTGKSINGFIRCIRLNRAAQLLRDSDCNLSEIMDRIGMSNRTYFTKIFKEEFGISPAEYRDNQRR